MSSKLYFTISIFMTTLKEQCNRKLRNKIKKSCNVHNQKDKKWSTFTYAGKEVYHINSLFKKQDFGVAYKTKNNIKRIFNRQININKCPK